MECDDDAIVIKFVFISCDVIINICTGLLCDVFSVAFGGMPSSSSSDSPMIFNI